MCFPLRNQVGDWFFGRNRLPHRVQDNCDSGDGLPCNPTCGAHAGGGNTAGHRKIVFFVLLLALAAAVVGCGLKYKRRHKTVVPGGIYEDAAHATCATTRALEREGERAPGGETL